MVRELRHIERGGRVAISYNNLFDGYRVRKPARDLQLRRRNGLGHNLTANDQVELEYSMKVLQLLLVYPVAWSDNVERDSIVLPTLLTIAIIRCLTLKYAPEVGLKPNLKLTIVSIVAYVY